MQVVTEGLALYAFRDMRNADARAAAAAAPHLRRARRGAPHRLRHQVPVGAWCRSSPTRERAALEDFAFESARLLIDSRAGLSMRDQVLGDLAGGRASIRWRRCAKLAAERDVVAAALQQSGGRLGPVSGFVIPTLRAIGLFSERIRGHFAEMFEANIVAPRARDLASAGATCPRTSRPG